MVQWLWQHWFHWGIRAELDWICFTSEGQKPRGQRQLTVIDNKRAPQSRLPSISISAMFIWTSPQLWAVCLCSSQSSARFIDDNLFPPWRKRRGLVLSEFCLFSSAGHDSGFSSLPGPANWSLQNYYFFAKANGNCNGNSIRAWPAPGGGVYFFGWHWCATPKCVFEG